MKTRWCEQKNVLDIFFKITLSGAFFAVLGFLIALISSTSVSQSANIFEGIFSDFVEIMNVSIEESPYIIEGSSYPPLAIMILYPFALICSSVFAKYAGLTLTVNELTSRIVVTPQFWISISLFFIVCTSLIVLLVSKKYGFRQNDLFKIAITVITSAPFAYAVIRGNTIYFALIFTMVFITLKDSDRPLVRELSYICLAIAGCLKIYPLFFGVFLLKDKKIFASLRVAAYFFALFFTSFFFFETDLSNVFEFTENLGGFMSNEARLLGYNNLSLSSIVFKAMHLFAPDISAGSTAYTIISLIAIISVFALGTIAAIMTKNDLTRLIISSFVIVLIPSISYFYVLIFTIIPLLEYIKTQNYIPKTNSRIYLFSFLFLYISFFVLPRFFLLHSILIIALLMYEILGVFRNEIFRKK